MTRSRLTACLLVLMTLVVFLPACQYQFVSYDDTAYVTENPFVKNGLNWPDFKWAFTAFYAGNWHPLTWLSHQLDCQCFGLNPAPQHLVNVLFHAANVALLFGLCRQLTSRFWSSAMIAALFAWHPLHVESVAWIAERKDLLSAFFALLSLWSYARYAQNRKPSFFWLSALFFALGLLAKPILVTLPFLLLLLDYWPLQRISPDFKNRESLTDPKSFFTQVRCLFWEKWPFFILALVSCVITVFAQKSGGAIMSFTRVPFSMRLENAPVAIVGYLRKFVWPSDLCAIYMLHPEPAWKALSSLLVLVVISAAAWHWRLAKPYLIVGWLWFVGMLFPVLGLVQAGMQSMADRYTYLSSIGLFLALAGALADYWEERNCPKAIRVGSCLLVLATCIRVTEFQLPFWRDSEALFRRATSVTNNNLIAMVNLGVALDAEHRFKEAVEIYRQAEPLDPGTFFQLHNNLGNILGLLGHHKEALKELTIALGEQPTDAQMHVAAGNQLMALTNYAEARRQFSDAEQLNPDLAMAHWGMAQALLKSGLDAAAIVELRQATRLAPDNFKVLTLDAAVLAASQDATVRDGKTALLLACKANDLSHHTQFRVFDAMGMACAEVGDFTNAVACAETAIKLATSQGNKVPVELLQRLERYHQHQPWRESFMDQPGNLPEGN